MCANKKKFHWSYDEKKKKAIRHLSSLSTSNPSYSLIMAYLLIDLPFVKTCLFFSPFCLSIFFAICFHFQRNKLAKGEKSENREFITNHLFVQTAKNTNDSSMKKYVLKRLLVSCEWLWDDCDLVLQSVFVWCAACRFSFSDTSRCLVQSLEMV